MGTLSSCGCRTFLSQVTSSVNTVAARCSPRCILGAKSGNTYLMMLFAADRIGVQDWKFGCGPLLTFCTVRSWLYVLLSIWFTWTIIVNAPTFCLTFCNFVHPHIGHVILFLGKCAGWLESATLNEDGSPNTIAIVGGALACIMVCFCYVYKVCPRFERCVLLRFLFGTFGVRFAGRTKGVRRLKPATFTLVDNLGTNAHFATMPVGMPGRKVKNFREAVYTAAKQGRTFLIILMTIGSEHHAFQQRANFTSMAPPPPPTGTTPTNTTLTTNKAFKKGWLPDTMINATNTTTTTST